MLSATDRISADCTRGCEAAVRDYRPQQLTPKDADLKSVVQAILARPDSLPAEQDRNALSLAVLREDLTSVEQRASWALQKMKADDAYPDFIVDAVASCIQAHMRLESQEMVKREFADAAKAQAQK